MQALTSGLLSTQSLSKTEIESLFQLADRFSKNFSNSKSFFGSGSSSIEHLGRTRKVVAYLFFEPSTRTRVSFEIAAQRLGVQISLIEPGPGTSIVKGESAVDTVMNVLAMQPDALVVRYGNDPELDRLLPTLSIPVLNAGCGTQAHPTQALADAYTLSQVQSSAVASGNGPLLAGLKVLIFGDVRHSRVAYSNFDVLQKLGAEVGVSGPMDWMPETLPAHVRRFADLDAGFGWANVVMGLRVQLERHRSTTDLSELSRGEYLNKYGLSSRRLQNLSANTLIMHPGPINHGVEFDETVISDPRSLIFKQVASGVYIRAALLARVLNLELP